MTNQHAMFKVKTDLENKIMKVKLIYNEMWNVDYLNFIQRKIKIYAREHEKVKTNLPR